MQIPLLVNPPCTSIQLYYSCITLCEPYAYEGLVRLRTKSIFVAHQIARTQA
jgi:hypothetical protein